jgi:Kelch motif
MGKCISKDKSPKPDLSKKIENIYYKPKASSNALIACRLPDKAFKEVSILGDLNFQTGSLFGKLDSARYFCIGGLYNGEQGLILNIVRKSYSQIISPPMSLAYGSITTFNNKVYIVGALTIEASGQEKPAPPLCFNVYENCWTELSPMPIKLCLAGTYLIGEDLYLLGGYLNYPDYPIHFRSILIYNLESQNWVRSNIETPIFQGLPACCVVSPNEIFIIGGHDPCDRITDVESKNTYLFNGSAFEPCPDIPAVGQLRFQESPAYYNGQVFIYSEDDILFIYHLQNKNWSYIDYEQSASKLSSNDLAPYETTRTYLYRYIMEECEIIEYNITLGTNRKTGPSSFKYSFRYTGMCMLEDGRLLFAGGLKENDDASQNAWTLNPKIGSCSNVCDLSCPQYGLRMIVVQGIVYAIAGIETFDDKTVCRCQKYFPVTNTWEYMPSMEYSAFLPGVAHLDGKIYAIGGRSDGDVCYIIQAYDISRVCWEVIDVEYPCSAMGIGAVAVLDKILCFGGKTPDGIEVTNCYSFDGAEFKDLDDLPESEVEDSTFFLDPIVNTLGKVYAVSTAGIVFECINDKWSKLYSD